MYIHVTVVKSLKQGLTNNNYALVDSGEDPHTKINNSSMIILLCGLYKRHQSFLPGLLNLRTDMVYTSSNTQC